MERCVEWLGVRAEFAGVGMIHEVKGRGEVIGQGRVGRREAGGWA